MTGAAPSFPPLFSGLAVAAGTDPFQTACARAALGCDAGLVVYDVSGGALHAAIVFAPEMPLDRAISVQIACAIGFQNALGALAPPEVAVHLMWPLDILVNGARCGRFRVAAAHGEPQDVPDWIVVGLEIPMLPAPNIAGGNTPDETCLFEEGCAEIEPIRLLESWVRHTLIWITRMLDDGNAPLNEHWRGIAHGVGEDVAFALHGTGYRGTFLGVDEFFGMILRDGVATQIVPLIACLEGGAS